MSDPPLPWRVAQEVLVTLLQHERTHGKAFTAVVEFFVDSPGFDHTRWIWPYIAREPHIASDQLRRLEYAVETNRQVYQANVDFASVSDLVKALVEKFEPPDPWAGEVPPF